jgi:hypothetical protein
MSEPVTVAGREYLATFLGHDHDLVRMQICRVEAEATTALRQENERLRADKDAAHARAAERENEIDALEAKLAVGSLTMALCQSGVISLRDQRSKHDLPRRYAEALRAMLFREQSKNGSAMSFEGPMAYEPEEGLR